MMKTFDEIEKLLSFLNFIMFTAENESEFTDNFLPTLDLQTQVQDYGKILYMFFRKSMANNLTFQYVTALPKNTIFALSGKI